jgi:hypothetical protein
MMSCALTSLDRYLVAWIPKILLKHLELFKVHAIGLIYTMFTCWYTTHKRNHEGGAELGYVTFEGRNVVYVARTSLYLSSIRCGSSSSEFVSFDAQGVS